MFLRNVFSQFFIAKCFKKSLIFNVSYRHPKNSVGFNGIRTHDLCEAGAMLYQLNYEATWLGGDQFVVSCVAIKVLMKERSLCCLNVLIKCEDHFCLSCPSRC